MLGCCLLFSSPNPPLWLYYTNADKTIKSGLNLYLFLKGICQASTTIIPSHSGNTNLDIVLNWPETQFEDTAYVSCPCGNMTYGTGEESQASRLCGRDANNGTHWEMAYVAPCNFTDTARIICQIANVRILKFHCHGMNSFFYVSFYVSIYSVIIILPSL